MTDPSRFRSNTQAHVLLLLLGTLAVFWQVKDFDFVMLDDLGYVVQEPWVVKGLSWSRMCESLVTFRFANWHPVTWWSLMLDSTLFGLNPHAFHLVNLAIHLANVLLLYAWLRQVTGDGHRSMLVALLFAVHPLHVEPVAWISGRKDLLCTFWMLLTLILYSRRSQTGEWWCYPLLLLTFAIGLMSKSMLVTLPALLLLVDFWPLGRFTRSTGATATAGSSGAGGQAIQQTSLRWIILEKVPLLAMSLGAAVLTYFAQQEYGAVQTTTSVPLDIRLQNAVFSLQTYIIQSVFPTRLAAYYPIDPDGLTLSMMFTSVAIVMALSVLAIAVRCQRPAVAFGWCWFLVSLLPVIGLIQLSDIARADRYMYVPLTGLLVALVWGLELDMRLLQSPLAGLRTLAVCGFVAALAVAAHRQTGYWQNSLSLLNHTISVTSRNWLCHSNLASYYMKRRQVPEAIKHARLSLEYKPGHRLTSITLGLALEHEGEWQEAYDRLESGVNQLRRTDPANRVELLKHLGIVATKLERWHEAHDAFRRALALQPDHRELQNLLADATREKTPTALHD